MPTSSTNRSDRASRWARWALVVYWPVMFASTHWPKLEIPLETPAIPFDKLAHFGMYALLGCLCLVAVRLIPPGSESARPILSHWRWWLGVPAVLVAYAVFDELTQPLFARDADPLDLIADSLAILLATGLGLAWVARRRKLPAAASTVEAWAGNAR